MDDTVRDLMAKGYQRPQAEWIASGCPPRNGNTHAAAEIPFKAPSAAEVPVTPIEPARPPAAATETRKATRARKASEKTTRPTPVKQSDIRAWARENGIEVNPRGTVWPSVQDQYLAELAEKS
jgi:hypothetical protein